MSRPLAVLLCGPSLAGKSTAAGRIAAALDAVIISADAENAGRGNPFGNQGLPGSAWAETFAVLLARLREAGRSGRAAVLDDTLCFRALRDRARAEADAAGLAASLLVLRPPRTVLLARHRALEASGARPVLAPETMADHLDGFEWPERDEHPVDVTEPADLETWLAVRAPGDRTVEPLGPGDYGEIAGVWAASVRATHGFLHDGFVEDVQPRLAAEFLPMVELWGVRGGDGRLAAFLGTAGKRIEMLFVAPEHFGRGLGRRLMGHAVAVLGATEVDVNEQNAQAVGFYRRLGFGVAGRSAVDGQGQPYPILHMTLGRSGGRGDR